MLQQLLMMLLFLTSDDKPSVTAISADSETIEENGGIQF